MPRSSPALPSGPSILQAAVLLSLPLLAACGSAAPNASAPIAAEGAAQQAQAPAAPAAAAQAQPAAQLPATQPAAPAQQAPVIAAVTQPVVFQLAAGQSKATFKVREQLAGRNLPNDAVGSTTGVAGQIAIGPDGTLVAGQSTITVDMSSLATDSGMRDNFIKSNTIQTRQYPTATFVPVRIEGLPGGLPDSGEYHFMLVGQLTIHGVTRETSWDVTASRSATGISGTATTTLHFGDFGMTPPRAPAVLSVVDEIRLEMSLVATQAK